MTMNILPGLGQRARGLFSDIKGPWGPKSGDNDAGSGDTGTNEPGGEGPWGGAAKGRRPASALGANANPLEDFLRKSRARFGGGGGGGIGGLPGRPDRSTIFWGVLALVTLWLLFSIFTRIAPEQRGVVTTFGRYSHTLNPGIGMTLPWPIQSVQKVDVENIRNIDLGSTGTEELMLTGDQNIIDIAYSVRWNIRDPESFLFEVANPEETIRQVAESSMRAVVSRVTLDDAIGDKRGEIEASVQEMMQQILDGYGAGVSIRGVAIKQADPPQAVNDAFKEVSAAQQEAQSYINQARAYALQLTAKAQGEATAFDKVYEEYRLAPDVTRRRMYYETMERVLQNVDKTIVEAPGVTPYLPLDQLQRRRQPAQPQQESGQ
jgi:modulator of FtsH protease HflK